MSPFASQTAQVILRACCSNRPSQLLPVKFSVGVTCHAEILEIEGLFTQGSRPGQTVGESVDGILAMDSSDWSNGIRYHIFDTRPDSDFKTKVNDCTSLQGGGRGGVGLELLQGGGHSAR